MRSLDRMGDWKLYAVASLGIVATTVAMIALWYL
jgi:hypothetical protein